MRTITHESNPILEVEQAIVSALADLKKVNGGEFKQIIAYDEDADPEIELGFTHPSLLIFVNGGDINESGAGNGLDNYNLRGGGRFWTTNRRGRTAQKEGEAGYLKLFWNIYRKLQSKVFILPTCNLETLPLRITNFTKLAGEGANETFTGIEFDFGIELLGVSPDPVMRL